MRSVGANRLDPLRGLLGDVLFHQLLHDVAQFCNSTSSFWMVDIEQLMDPSLFFHKMLHSGNLSAGDFAELRKSGGKNL